MSRPLLRERAVLNSEVTKSNRFWRELIGLFELHWPYAADEAFQVDPTTTLFTFSGLYEKTVRDLRMWRMRTDFYKSFPDVFEDVMLITPIYIQPSTIPVRRPLQAAPSRNVVQEVQEEEPLHDSTFSNQPSYHLPGAAGYTGAISKPTPQPHSDMW